MVKREADVLAAWEGELATIQASVEGDKTSSALEKETKLIDPEKNSLSRFQFPKSIWNGW